MAIGRPKTNVGGNYMSGYADERLNKIIDQEVERLKRQGINVTRWHALVSLVMRMTK